MELIKSETFKNLARAYAGESQAHVRYKFIEYGARYNGYKCLAEIIDNIVYNEFQHARMFYTFIQKASDAPIENIEISTGYPFKQKWDIAENLRLAAQDEVYEATKIYPAFAKTARKEGFEDIAKLFENIIQVETCHYKLLTDLYEQFSTETLYKKPKPVKWKCAECGYEATDTEPWDECPICLAKKGSVMLHLKSE